MPDLEAILGQITALPSISGQEAELGEFCAQWLHTHGFKIHRQTVDDIGHNILAEKGPTGKSILLYAHLDTVPPSQLWQQNPFELLSEGDKLTGLGVSDMKSGLGIILGLAHALKPLDYCLKIALTIDEERYSRGAYELVKSDWCQDIVLALVPELSIDSTEETLGLGRKGLYSFELTFSSEGGHGALDYAQSNHPIILASRAAMSLANYPIPRDLDYGEESLLIGDISCQHQGLSLPESCTLSLHYFANPGRHSKLIYSELDSYISALFKQYSLTYASRSTPYLLGYAQSEGLPLVRAVQEIVQQFLGKPLKACLGISPADENVLAKHLNATILSLAPVGGNSHRAAEWVSRQSMERVFELYATILNKIGFSL